MAKCWMARWGMNLRKIPVDSYHPKPCGYCEVPMDRLVNAVRDFVEWADPTPEPGEAVPLHEEVEAFLGLTRAEQHEAVERAQGYAPTD